MTMVVSFYQHHAPSMLKARVKYTSTPRSHILVLTGIIRKHSQLNLFDGHQARYCSSKINNKFTKMISSLRTGRLITQTKNLSSSIRNSDKYSDNNKSAIDQDGYERAIHDLNSLQSNNQVLALAKYKAPETILPLFKRQVAIAGVNINDLDSLNVIHVSGTKGKGSTCAFAESILRSAGLKTGFYNSPHLVKVTERIKINGQAISEQLFSKYFREIYDRLIEGTRRENITMPSYFSFLTILAFHIFLEERVDCSLIEVGIGGEYDPTNLIQKPVACAITTLDLEHTNILGNSIESIAWTKAGIIKPGVPIFTIEHEQTEALEMIKARARDRGSPLYICKPMISLPTNEFHLGIDSQAQYINAPLACQLSKHLLEEVFPKILEKPIHDQSKHILDTDLKKLPKFFSDGLNSCRWPGRCEIVRYSRVAFFLDGAHTKKSMKNCLEWFASASNDLNETAQKILMVNVIGERDRYEVLRPLTNYDGFSHVIFSTNRINVAGDTLKSETFSYKQGPSSEKSLENAKNNAIIWKKLIESSSVIQPSYQIIVKDSIMDGFESIYELLEQAKHPNTKVHVLATGSLHFVGALIETLQSVDRSKL